MTEPLIWVCSIEDKYTVFCNWDVLPYIEWRVSWATQYILISSSIRPEKDGVGDVRIDSYKSIRSTELWYIDYWSQAYLIYDSPYLKML